MVLRYFDKSLAIEATLHIKMECWWISLRTRIFSGPHIREAKKAKSYTQMQFSFNGGHRLAMFGLLHAHCRICIVDLLTRTDAPSSLKQRAIICKTLSSWSLLSLDHLRRTLKTLLRVLNVETHSHLHWSLKRQTESTGWIYRVLSAQMQPSIFAAGCIEWNAECLDVPGPPSLKGSLNFVVSWVLRLNLAFYSSN